MEGWELEVMRHRVDSNQLIHAADVRALLAEMDLWKQKYMEANEALNEVQRILTQWRARRRHEDRAGRGL